MGIKCKVCKEEKDSSFFYKNKTYKSGFMSKCKVCQNAFTSAHSKANPEMLKRIRKKFYAANKEDYAVRAKKARLAKPEMYNSLNAQYQARKIQAMPHWLSSEQKDGISKMYSLAKKLEGLCGISYHVDHIVPLRGDNVCGLHVPWNLQVLAASMNMSKSNKHDPTQDYL